MAGLRNAGGRTGREVPFSPKLLAELNPGGKLDTAGERIAVPNVRRAAVRLASRVVVSKSKRTVIAYGARRQGTGAVSSHRSATRTILCLSDVGPSRVLCTIRGSTRTRSSSGTRTPRKRRRFSRPARKTLSAPSGSASRKNIMESMGRRIRGISGTANPPGASG